MSPDNNIAPTTEDRIKEKLEEATRSLNALLAHRPKIVQALNENQTAIDQWTGARDALQLMLAPAPTPNVPAPARTAPEKGSVADLAAGAIEAKVQRARRGEKVTQ